ncbi:MAG: TerD family protein [Oscillospiraceae bacterium]|nr:TerD family protein [Oscillospiraceae bacterium]
MRQFGVDSNDKLSDERYMIFYNQPVSPGNAVSMRTEGQDFIYTIDLGKLPGNIVKLVFTVSIDGNGTMGEIESHTLRILQNGSVCAELEISGSDFRREKAIIGMEIYNKTVWRCSIVARGFDGGLADLLANFGGQLADDEQQPSEIPTVISQSPTASYPVEPVQEEQQIADRMMSRINLSKDKIKLEKHAVNLSKCIIGLSKKNCIDLVNTKAKVVVALDYSGSMSSLYSNGTVQETLNKFVPL